MAEKKRKGRRAYLDSYKKKEDGSYAYEGDLYVYVGSILASNSPGNGGLKVGIPKGNGLKKELTRLWILCGALLCTLLAAGCSTAPGPDSSAYVLLPYAANLVACVSVCWGMGRLAKGGNPMKAHVARPCLCHLFRRGRHGRGDLSFSKRCRWKDFGGFWLSRAGNGSVDSGLVDAQAGSGDEMGEILRKVRIFI